MRGDELAKGDEEADLEGDSAGDGGEARRQAGKVSWQWDV